MLPEQTPSLALDHLESPSPPFSPHSTGEGLALEMLIPAPPGPRRQAGSRPPLGAPWPGGIRQLLFWCPSLCKQGPPHVPHWPHERVEATSTMCHASRVLVNPSRKGAEHLARGGGAEPRWGHSSLAAAGGPAARTWGTARAPVPACSLVVPRGSSTHGLPSAPQGLGSRTA